MHTCRAWIGTSIGSSSTRRLLGDRPAALVEQPRHERADAVGQRRRRSRSRPPAACRTAPARAARRRRAGSASPDDADDKRHVLRLQRLSVTRHHRCEARVDDALDRRRRAEARVQERPFRAARHEQLAHFPVGLHVRTSETVDRLLRVADDEELAGDRADAVASRSGRDRRPPAAAGSPPEADRCPGTRPRRGRRNATGTPRAP